MPFRILLAETNKPVIGYRGLPVEFADPQSAKAFAKSLTTLDKKYHIKKVHNTEWVQREQLKFIEKKHVHVPWTFEEWWLHKDFVAIHALHFPHPSVKEPGMLSYVETPAKGEEGVYTRLKPGRYLEKHFANLIRVYHVDVQFWAREFSDMYDLKKLFIATTEDEIQWVYENGPPSCMSSPEYRRRRGWGWPEAGKWPNNWHVCRGYAAGDLQVAYLVENDEKPETKHRVIARSVIWPEKKTFSRCYGAENKLKLALQSIGYNFCPPIGAKIQRKPLERKFLVPYLDAGKMAGEGSLSVLDKTTYMEICEKGTPFSWSTGSVTGLSGKQCDAGGHEQNLRFCIICDDNINQVPGCIRIENHQSPDDSFMCGGCRDEHAFMCSYAGQWYLRSQMETVNMADGTVWSQQAFNSRGFCCQATGENWPRSKVIRVNGKLWCHQYAQAHAFCCSLTMNWYENEHGKTVKGISGLVGPDAVASFCFTCSNCNTLTYNNDFYKNKGICRDCTNPSLPLTATPEQLGIAPSAAAFIEMQQMRSSPIPPVNSMSSQLDHIIQNFFHTQDPTEE